MFSTIYTLAAFVQALAPHLAVSDTAHCTQAARLLRTEFHMEAIVERDTIDDWRTHKKVPGCRITAAGATDVSVQRQAVSLYDAIRAAKWTRTPDPVDSPTEASLRFRWEASDCLFNVNAMALLNTDAEMAVNDRVRLTAGQRSYQVYVMCMRAMPAAP